MTKYKLIKEYPRSPKLGTEIEIKESEINTIKTYPEYWQEIIEKKYEILELYTNNHIIPVTKSSVDIKAFNDKATCTKKWTIKSIKRLTDNEIFTVGDDTEQGVIKSIEITQDDLFLQTAKTWNYLNMIKKKPVEQVLFITEDKYKITSTYKGNLYFVDKTTFEFKTGLVVSLNDMLKTFSTSCFIFHSFEKAKDFVTRNKPCLSLKEISQIYITANKYDPKNPNVQGQAEKLYRFVQQKLKL